MSTVENTAKKKALFIQVGSFSHINSILLKHLQNRFSLLEFDVIDIWPNFIKNDLLNILYCLTDYGSSIIKGKSNLASSLLKNTYIFNKVKSRIMEYTSDKDYLFTIQTQSLFDASTSKVPNFVYTDHTHLANLKYPGYSKDKLASANWIELERSIYQNAALIFTISENIRFSIVDQYTINPQKVKCVYAGCNIPVSPLNMSKSPKYSNKNILFVGLDWQRKGGPQLIQAFYKVLEKHPDATLTIVGASPRLNIPNCSVIGKVPLSEVAKYYEQASVFCLPTTLEPFGIVFLEAMTHKIPIVATNIGAIPEFIIDGESGYLIPPNNVKLLAERLIDLLDDPNKCQSFGDKGYKLASSKYSWENTSMLMYEHIMNYLRCNN